MRRTVGAPLKQAQWDTTDALGTFLVISRYGCCRLTPVSAPRIGDLQNPAQVTIQSALLVPVAWVAERDLLEAHPVALVAGAHVQVP